MNINNNNIEWLNIFPNTQLVSNNSVNIRFISFVNTAESPIDELHIKINLPTNQEGCGQSESTVETSQKMHSIVVCTLFGKIICL